MGGWQPRRGQPGCADRTRQRDRRLHPCPCWPGGHSPACHQLRRWSSPDPDRDPPSGPPPADTVVQQKILAPVRTHTRITPQQTNIIPKVEVQNYNVDVPVHVPVPVERTVIVNKHVPEPYEVPVPRAVPVPAPYKVHPVQEIVETPHVHHATYTTH